MGEKRKIIAILDDSASCLMLSKDVLSGIYKIYTFNSSELMFIALENITPDLILLDIEMPEMDGYEVISLLKCSEATKDIPVIFLTAHNSTENESKGFSLGAIDFIIKPFSAPRLLKRIEMHLLLDSQRRELISYSSRLEKAVEKRTWEITELKNAFINSIAELIEYRDLNTGGHIDRTQRYMRIFLEAMKERQVYGSEIRYVDIDLVVQSSQLHDVGKIAIDDKILRTPGKLTPEEFEGMKMHPEFGERIISKIQERVPNSEFLEYAKICALYHHEKWDGSGYPKGLKGEKIPLLGRVMAIVDVYDAVVSKRPYKDAISHGRATEIIKKDSGIHFDPVLVELFLDIQDVFAERI